MILEPVPSTGALRQRIQAEETDLTPFAIDCMDPDVAAIEQKRAEENAATMQAAQAQPEAVTRLAADQFRR